MQSLTLSFAIFVVGAEANESAGSILTHHYTFDTDGTDAVGTNHGTLTNGASVVFDAERGGACLNSTEQMTT